MLWDSLIVVEVASHGLFLNERRMNSYEELRIAITENLGRVLDTLDEPVLMFDLSSKSLSEPKPIDVSSS